MNKCIYITGYMGGKVGVVGSWGRIGGDVLQMKHSIVQHESADRFGECIDAMYYIYLYDILCKTDWWKILAHCIRLSKPLIKHWRRSQDQNVGLFIFTEHRALYGQIK